MRFAPPPAMRVANRGGGFNQTSVRTYNERLVMSLLRQHGSLSRMDLGQLSGLSAQTISVIVRALEHDKLIVPGEVQRGRVGPPSTPMFLNADGAFAIGIKIGTKSTDIVLIDFLGSARHHDEFYYASPDVNAVINGIGAAVSAIKSRLTDMLAERLVGVGISLPSDIDEWTGGTWREIDLEARVSSMAGLSTYIQNDVTAAAAAEGTFGAARSLGDFLYFFVGAQTASRLILNHHIYAGRRNVDDGGASLIDLAAAVSAAGANSDALWRVGEWPDVGDALDQWIDKCGTDLANAIHAATGLVDVNCAIIDGRFPAGVRDRIVEATRSAARAQGEPVPGIIAGKTGALAKAIGAASLAFHSRFMVDHVGLAHG
jgi:predicted NBD/HSP70 family sugar kinase